MSHPQDDSQRFIESLRKEGRALKQARMLPMTPLTDDHVAAVRRDYLGYTKKHGIYRVTVCRETGLSASVLSQFGHGKYNGDNAEVARVLNDWMERNARQREAELPKGFVLTGIAEEIQTVVNVACTTNSMAAIVAPSGSGKSMVLDVLSEKHRGRLLYCTEDMTPKEFMRKLCQKVEAGSTHYTKALLMDSIVEKLRGTNRPIFLDEAHRLPAEVLPRIRAIHDQTEVPVIMTGTHEILNRINDRSDGRGQFASRCLQYNCLEHIVNAENPTGAKLGRPLFTREEVAAFLANLNVKFRDDAMDLAWAIACLPNHGCLRTIKRVVMLVRTQAASREKPISRGEIRRALSLLFGQTGAAIGRYAERHLELAQRAA
ncbi:MAG: ATP-binding protein [Phycisphaerales bacterium]